MIQWGEEEKLVGGAGGNGRRGVGDREGRDREVGELGQGD